MNYKLVELLRHGLEGSTDESENPDENDQYKSKPRKRCSTKRYSPEPNKKVNRTLILPLPKVPSNSSLIKPVSASSPLTKQLLTSESTSSFNDLPLSNVHSTSALMKPICASSPTINNHLLTSGSKSSENSKHL